MADVCGKMGFILRILAEAFYYIKIVVPIILIIMIIFDLAKVAVGQADDKTKKEATSKIVKRVIYAAIVFLVPTVVNLIFRTIENVSLNNGSATSWVSCWTRYYK